ncbi:hypothetical protein MP228_009115 [Amoeboaphelidium protococcarum]|nr:hypothetical protein MP228_009115 [Amoeboaphelidium protococcarum]
MSGNNGGQRRDDESRPLLPTSTMSSGQSTVRASNTQLGPQQQDNNNGSSSDGGRSSNNPSPIPGAIPLQTTRPIQSILKKAPVTIPSVKPPGKKMPNRTTKTNKKLVLFPSANTAVQTSQGSLNQAQIEQALEEEVRQSKDSLDGPLLGQPRSGITGDNDDDALSEYASEYADDDLFSSSTVALDLHRLDPGASSYTAYNTRMNMSGHSAIKPKSTLPRVTAYCTSSSYKMDKILMWLRSSEMRDGCGVESVRRVDECIWLPYTPPVSIFETLSGGGGGGINGSAGGGVSRRFRQGQSAQSYHNHQQQKRVRQRDKINNLTFGNQYESADSRSQGYGDYYQQQQQQQQNHSYSSQQQQQQQQQQEQNGRPGQAEVFIFEYGVVVLWNLTLPQEQHFLSLLHPFEEEKLRPEDVEVEEFRFVYRDVGTAKIYNDVITLRTPQDVNLETIDEEGVALSSGNSLPSVAKYNHQSQDSWMKLTLSHAIAQSVKLTLYEGRIEDTIESTKDIPAIMSVTGRVPMSRSNITKKIGHLFVMRINVNLVSPILDTPELFWSLPNLEPLYAAARTYLEISQRVDLLNQRVGVLSDLLEMLKDHLNSMHGEYLEWIIIWLIAIEILIGIITILFDFFSLYGGGKHD